MYFICSLKPAKPGVLPMEDPIVCETTLDVESVVSSYSRNYVVLVTRAIALSDVKPSVDYGNEEE